MSLISCNKTQNEPDNTGEEPTTENPYPYLRLSDLTPLHMISLAKAEEKLAKMGFNGGKQTSGEYEGKYVYISKDKNEKIHLSPNSEGIIESMYYTASKGVIPSNAKGWLAHLSESVTIPTWKDPLPFYIGVVGGIGVLESYTTYVKALDNLASGMSVRAIWGHDFLDSSKPTGDYCGIDIQYSYENNIDFAMLLFGIEHHTYQDNKPQDPLTDDN